MRINMSFQPLKLKRLSIIEKLLIANEIEKDTAYAVLTANHKIAVQMLTRISTDAPALWKALLSSFRSGNQKLLWAHKSPLLNKNSLDFINFVLHITNL